LQEEQHRDESAGAHTPVSLGGGSTAARGIEPDVAEPGRFGASGPDGSARRSPLMTVLERATSWNMFDRGLEREKASYEY
jgi:hypothetical protein